MCNKQQLNTSFFFFFEVQYTTIHVNIVVYTIYFNQTNQVH